MIHIELLVVGKLREKWLQQGAQEYEKRLGRLAKVKTIEIADQPCPKGEAEQEAAKAKEAEQILSRLNARSFVVVLAVEGKPMSSPGLAKLFQDLSLGGTGSVTFIIGGSMGLSQSVLDRADLKLSFSAFTFPHQLMRVILLDRFTGHAKLLPASNITNDLSGLIQREKRRYYTAAGKRPSLREYLK